MVQGSFPELHHLINNAYLKQNYRLSYTAYGLIENFLSNEEHCQLPISRCCHCILIVDSQRKNTQQYQRRLIYASLKSTFSGLQLTILWLTVYGSIFIHFAVVTSHRCEITQNSEKIRTYSSSRSSKVINLIPYGANRKRTCNFLLPGSK